MKMPVISVLTLVLSGYTNSALKDHICELDHAHLIPTGAQSVNCAQATLVGFNPKHIPLQFLSPFCLRYLCTGLVLK